MNSSNKKETTPGLYWQTFINLFFNAEKRFSFDILVGRKNPCNQLIQEDGSSATHDGNPKVTKGHSQRSLTNLLLIYNVLFLFIIVRKYDFFQIAYDIARCTRDAFNQKALPRFFQCAPTVGIYGQRGDNSLEVNQIFHTEQNCTNYIL